MAMRKILGAVAALILIAAPAYSGVGISWSVYYGAYSHAATNLMGWTDSLLDSSSVTWQLVYAGANNAIDLPSLTTGGANGDYVSGDDQVWARRTIPMGGGTAPEDETVWDNWMLDMNGDTQSGNAFYSDLSWHTAGFVYMRVYEGPPMLESWYYETPLMALDTSYEFGATQQQFYVDSYEQGFQPNQQITQSLEGPYLIITNADDTVAFGVSNLAVGGVAQDLDSSITWYNTLTGQSGNMSVPQGSWLFICRLGVGTNSITASSYVSEPWDSLNPIPPLGQTILDTLVVVRSAAPRLDITNASAVVAIGTSNLTVGGASSGLSGAIGWTNHLGGSGSLAAAASWSFTSPLQFGTNVITARGTNSFGEAATDTVEVVRSETLGPRLDVTYAGDARNFLFTIPAGYRLGSVHGADMAVAGAGFVWSNLTEGLHYTVDGANVTIQPAGSRKLMRMGLTFP
ncbi:MAG: hypothetical protein EOM72_07360 [Opitutae bacterium]|nr:hypothetical protein [Opitutae bacterium]